MLQNKKGITSIGGIFKNKISKNKKNIDFLEARKQVINMIFKN